MHRILAAVDRIIVQDNFLDSDEVNLLYDICWHSDLYLKGVESNYADEDRDSRKWSLTKFILTSDPNYKFYNKLAKRILDHESIKGKYECFRILLNAYKYSDVLSVHTDVHDKVDGCMTALVYGNNKWDINWGSETVFLSSMESDAEIIQSVIPKPGRMVLFDADIPHTGRPPVSIFPNYRYSIAFNLRPKSNSVI